MTLRTTLGLRAIERAILVMMDGELTPRQQVVYRELRTLLASQAWQVDESELTLDFDVFHQVDEVDSLDMVELAVSIEEYMDVRVGDDEIRRVRSMRDLVLLVSSRMAD